MDRNVIVALLIPAILTYLQQFIDLGFASFQSEWNKSDYLFDKEVTVMNRDQKIVGIVLGVDELGQLRLQTADKTVITCAAGEATLR